MRLLLSSCLPVVLFACSQPSEQESSSPRSPTTLYGESVKKARDLQAHSEQEEETKRHVKELLDE